MLEIEASKLNEISGLTKTANCLPRGVTPVNTRKRNLNQNKTIFTNTTLSYAFLQFMSQIHDVACSTSCMILHGLLMDSLLNLKTLLVNNNYRSGMILDCYALICLYQAVSLLFNNMPVAGRRLNTKSGSLIQDKLYSNT